MKYKCSAVVSYFNLKCFSSFLISLYLCVSKGEYTSLHTVRTEVVLLLEGRPSQQIKAYNIPGD
jgi:hypothetical protein